LPDLPVDGRCSEDESAVLELVGGSGEDDSEREGKSAARCCGVIRRGRCAVDDDVDDADDGVGANGERR
jgi:hypothetical protein